MNQLPPSENPFGASGQLPAGLPPASPQKGGSLWLWIVGIVGALCLLPCLCCGGIVAYSATVKELAISNGQHLGGPPLNVKFDYAFADQGRGMPKSYFIVVKAADGTRKERSVAGFGFGPQRIAMRGTWQFTDSRDLGPERNKLPVKVWIESEDHRGSRSTASNTLTIYPKG